MEVANGTLPFLDVVVNINLYNVETWVYRKDTYTGVMLNFSSIAPLKWKRSLITCLLHRATVVCSTQTLLNQEIVRLKNIFFSNGYTERFF